MGPVLASPWDGSVPCGSQTEVNHGNTPIVGDVHLGSTTGRGTLATREGVALFDMSSFAKFRLEGPDAEAVLQDVCTCDAAIAAGDVRYTQWLNKNGGIEADLTISRLNSDTFLVVTGAAAATRDFVWLKKHIGDRRAAATDVTAPGFRRLA